ncbi:MAG: hypothetical protein QXN17_03825 [Nitrososphaerota archaeon]
MTTTIISIRVTEEEKKVIEILAQYLYKQGKIREPTIGDTMRACLYFMVNEILKAIEAERYAG